MRPPYLGKTTAAAKAVLPTDTSMCSIFVYPKNGIAASYLGFVRDTPILIRIRLRCYVPSQIIPKSRVVYLADKQILKRHILRYPKIIVSKISPGRVSIPGPWTISFISAGG